MQLDQSKSAEYVKRATGLIPQLSQTMSKAPYYYVQGVQPSYLERGRGATVWDVDGNSYIDYVCGLGAVTLGYNCLEVDKAIMAQLFQGISFSQPHRLEVEVSELLRQVIPCAEMVRFSKTGSEVCAVALKLARAYTGRDKFLTWSYHGWHDHFSIDTDRAKGIPKSFKDYIIQFPYNDLKPLYALFDQYPNQIAAVFMEPVAFTAPFPGYLAKVKELCHDNGALLIFDEMVTGFRWKLGGAQQYYEVTPDLATFGKGMANGMPIAAVCGRKEVMKECENIFFSTTFGGETLSLAAAKATIEFMRDSYYFSHIHNNIGVRLMNGIDGLTHLGLKFTGYSCRPYILLDDETPELRSLFMQELAKRGFLIHSGAWNLCYAHTVDDVKRTLKAVEESMTLIRAGEVKLEGKVAKMSFRRL